MNQAANGGANNGNNGTRPPQVRYLVEHRMVDVVVTTAGGVEEDLIKTLAPTYVGDFALAGAGLRARGLNRVGNCLVPNSNYCKFEDWLMPLLDAMLEEQRAAAAAGAAPPPTHASAPDVPLATHADGGGGAAWTPSRMIARLGRACADPSSVCYWAARNGIPIFCPALTDGSIGDMLYFHAYRRSVGPPLPSLPVQLGPPSVAAHLCVPS